MNNLVSPYQPRQYIKDIIRGQFVSVVGGLLAGFILASRVDHLELLPGFFILFPGFLELQGSLNGTLAARIGSLIHLGRIESVDELTDPRVKENLMATFALCLSASFILGIFAFFLSYLILSEAIFSLILISLLASILSSLVLIPTTFIMVVWSYKKGYDPDNIMGPFVTSLGDMIGIISLIVATGLLIK